MSRNADAAVTAVVLSVLGFLVLWGFVFVCGAWLIPYSVETWAAWLGHTVVIQWWKGLLIGFIAGILLRRGILWVAVTSALITWLVALCGFTGF